MSANFSRAGSLTGSQEPCTLPLPRDRGPLNHILLNDHNNMLSARLEQSSRLLLAGLAIRFPPCQ